MNLTLVSTRGAAVESEHPISAVLCDSTGDIKERVGNPMVTTWRSAAKPFQLESNIDCLPRALQAALSDSAMAVGAASHSGENYHIKQIEQLCSLFDIDESQLRCGGHWPLHQPTKETMLRLQKPFSAIHNNCSGKHSFMVAATNELDAHENYLPISHPVQVRILERIQERTHDGVADTVIDGCGVPCFVLPLEKMATAWATLGVEMSQSTSSLGKIGRAMAAQPQFVSGTGRLDLALYQALPEPLVTKIGAEGLICGAYPQRGLGFALKVRTGVSAMRPLALWETLNHWFSFNLRTSAISNWVTVSNVVGKAVGKIIPRWEF